MALLIKVTEAATMLGVARNRCYEWVRRGILPAARDGRRLYVPVRAVEKLAEKIEAGEFLGPTDKARA